MFSVYTARAHYYYNACKIRSSLSFAWQNKTKWHLTESARTTVRRRECVCMAENIQSWIGKKNYIENAVRCCWQMSCVWTCSSWNKMHSSHVLYAILLMCTASVWFSSCSGYGIICILGCASNSNSCVCVECRNMSGAMRLSDIVLLLCIAISMSFGIHRQSEKRKCCRVAVWPRNVCLHTYRPQRCSLDQSIECGGSVSTHAKWLRGGWCAIYCVAYIGGENVRKSNVDL